MRNPGRFGGIVSMATGILVACTLFAWPQWCQGSGKPHEGKVLRGIILSTVRWDPIFGPYDGPPNNAPLIKEFEDQTGVKVQVEKIAWGSLSEKQMLELTAPKGYVSFMAVDYSFYPRYVKYLEPLDGYISNPGLPDPQWDDVTAAGKQLVTVDGKIYGMPMYPSSAVLVGRKDLLQKYGLGSELPGTWSDLVQYARKLTVDTDGDGKIDQYGFTTPLKKNEIQWAVIDFFDAWGVDIFDKSMKPAFNSEKGVQAFETFCSLARYMPPSVLGDSHDECSLQFAQGKAAMYLNWSFIMKALREGTMPRERVADMIWAPVPSQETNHNVLVGWSFVMPKNAPEKDAAYLLLHWLGSAKTARSWQFTKTPGPPVRKSVLNDPEVIKLNPEFPCLARSLEGGRVVPPVPLVDWFKVQDVLQTYFTYGFSGQMKPKEALDAAAVKVSEIMSKAGN